MTGGLLLLGAVVLEAQVPSGMALRGTIVFDDPRRSVALLELPGGQRLNARIGDDIAGAGRLVDIGVRGLRFEQTGRQVAFSFNDSAFKSSGLLLPGALGSGSALEQQRLAGAPRQRIEARPFVVPERNLPLPRDAEVAELDATPQPGQVIEETDWDTISRQSAELARNTPGSPTYRPSAASPRRSRATAATGAAQRAGEKGPALDNAGGYRTLADGSQVYVVPDTGRPPPSDASHPWLDATPKPGQTIDTAPRGR